MALTVATAPTPPRSAEETLEMAKALLGYMGGDSRLHNENQRLRRQISDLQSVVLRLQAENDALVAELHHDDLLLVPESISEPSRASI